MMEGRYYWRECFRQIAIRIGKGEEITEQSIPEFYEDIERAQLVESLKIWGIPVRVLEPEKHAEGLNLTNNQLLKIVSKSVKEQMEIAGRWYGPYLETSPGLPEDPRAYADTSTFYESLEAYRAHLEANGDQDEQGNLTGYVRKCLDRLKYLKEAHTDMVLTTGLTLPAIEAMASHWRNRPKTSKGTRCSKYHARDMLKELWRYLRWLDKQPQYRWTIPKGVDDINRSPVDLPQDNQAGVFQTTTKKSYTPEQLGLIIRNTDNLGKAIIAVSVNCAFGASEIGQWDIAKIVLNQKHPHSDKIGIDTTNDDSWIVGNRPKTGVYSEHLLWSKVAEAVKPFLDGREVLPITKTGTRWYQTHRSNPQVKFNKWWGDLIKRIQKKHDIPYLPFGSLRDTFPDVLRQKYSDDVASLALHHGSLGEDKLLRCYANLPFGRLFQATRDLEEFFQPMLSEL